MNTVQSTPIQIDTKAKKSSRLWLLSFFVLVLLTIGAFAWTFLGLRESSSIYSSELTHNFGNVQEGDLLHHTFTVRNLHPWPITITAVGATCGCTTASLRHGSADRLLPMQSTSIDVALDTTGDRGMIQEGVIISTNGSNRYNVLYVKATVGAKSKSRKEGI